MYDYMTQSQYLNVCYIMFLNATILFFNLITADALMCSGIVCFWSLEDNDRITLLTSCAKVRPEEYRCVFRDCGLSFYAVRHCKTFHNMPSNTSSLVVVVLLCC